MAVGDLGVPLEVLKNTVNTITEEKGNMSSYLSSISEDVKNLRNKWDSPASQSLQGIAANMSDKFKDLETSVNSFAEFLTNVIQNYSETEAAATQQMTDVMNAFK